MANCSDTIPLHRARKTTLYYYDGSHVLPSIKSLTSNEAKDEHLLPRNVSTVLKLCFLYVARINEVLNLTIGDWLPPDRVLCHGSKKGISYLMFLPGLDQQISQWPALHDSTPLFNVTYQKCYRMCLKAGIYFNTQKGSNIRRLHCYRYIFSQKYLEVIGSQCLRDVLHHRSESSQRFYLNERSV